MTRTLRGATWARCAVAIAMIAAASSAHAEAPPPSASETPAPALPIGIALTAAPMFGAEAATGNGWNEIVARIDNPGSAPQKGVLELSVAAGYGTVEQELAARAPFAVPAGKTAVVVIPLHAFSAYYAPQVIVSAKGDSGAKLGSATVTLSAATNPLLVEVAQPARLAVALKGWPLTITWGTGPSASANTLTTGAPGFDRATGDPILPERPSGYASTTAVLVTSERLVNLDETKRQALTDWVNGGGTLAVVATRPEDLRAPALSALIGGDATRLAPPARLFTLPAYEKPIVDAPLDDPDATDPSPAPGTPHGPASGPHALRSGPAANVRDVLVGYEGGRLHASDFGATASCGLGEVHLLAFNPMESPAIDDPWARSRVIAMVERAWDRRARVAMPVGAGDRNPGRMDDVRRALDPNENFRLGLGVSAVLLVVYSLIVGPLVFTRAAKKGSPLLPLKWVPICSAVAFGAIVLVGLGIKGWRGRARHLTLLEVGSGSTRASMRAFRGFFASETRSLSVAPSDRASVLSLAPTDSMGRSGQGVLRLDAEGATLSELTSLPWQTVVVREDGFTDLKGGIVLRALGPTDFVIENHTGRVMKDVIAHGPGRGGASYFTTVDDGERIELSRGRTLGAFGSGLSRAGARRIHPLNAHELPFTLGPREGKRLAETWTPLENAAGDAVDWWPDDAPSLIAELIGAPHATRDAGLSVERDRVLVRVVGEVAQ